MPARTDWIESRFHLDSGLRLKQEVSHRLDETLSHRSQHHFAPNRNQQLILKETSQSRERGTSSGLTQMDAHSGVRYVSFSQQSIKSDEEIQIELRKFHPDLRYRSCGYDVCAQTIWQMSKNASIV